MCKFSLQLHTWRNKLCTHTCCTRLTRCTCYTRHTLYTHTAHTGVATAGLRFQRCCRAAPRTPSRTSGEFHFEFTFARVIELKYTPACTSTHPIPPCRLLCAVSCRIANIISHHSQSMRLATSNTRVAQNTQLANHNPCDFDLILTEVYNLVYNLTLTLVSYSLPPLRNATLRRKDTPRSIRSTAGGVGALLREVSDLEALCSCTQGGVCADPHPRPHQCVSIKQSHALTFSHRYSHNST